MGPVIAALAMTVALVVQDQAPLRASAHDSAPRQAALTQGDWLEVRGERQGYLQVYDHRRERPGYVRPSVVRRYAVDEATAPKLGTLVEYLEDMPGAESLGIGYAALFLRAAPPSAIGPEIFDAIGTMADRLARRASARTAKAGDAVAAQIETAESYGVHFTSFDKQGQTRVCYDGEAWKRVLSLGGTGNARARAALGLSDPACLDPALGPTEALAVTKAQAAAVDAVDPSKLAADVAASEVARLRVRRATVHAELAYFAARTGDATLAKDGADASKRELMLVDRAQLADDDRLAYDEAAMRVATVRWASEPAPAAAPGLEVVLAPGEPGQTCVRVKRAGSAQPFEHCTYAVVWPSSVRIAPHQSAVALVTQPLVGWSELLVLRPSQATGSWSAETLTPAAIDPDLGYVELAGFAPDGAHLLVARESRASGPLGAPNTLAPWAQRAFQLVATADLHVEKEASSLANFVSFRRWESAEWKGSTVALR
jgi:hypothetical protein